MTSGLLGFLGGIVAWFVTTLIGQPIVAFMAARNDAARVLAQYEEFDRHDPTVNDPSEETRIDRKKALSDAGSRLIAFTHSNQILSNALKRLSLFPDKAGTQLILLSNIKPYGTYNDRVRSQVMHYLRLGRRFGSHRI